MRNSRAEYSWCNHPIIGYVALDADDQPYQPMLRRNQVRKKPVTVYKTMKAAVNYSPVNKATEVRMFMPIEMPDDTSTRPM